MSIFGEMQAKYGLQHDNFTLDPRDDWFVYFGRSEFYKMFKDVIIRALKQGKAPKIVLWGDWGWGKTHTLWHFYHTMLEAEAVPYYVKCIEFSEKANFLEFYNLLMSAIDRDAFFDIVTQVVRQDSTFFDHIIEPVDSDFKHVCKNVIPIATDAGIKNMVWKWLCGYSVKGNEQSIGVNKEKISDVMAAAIVRYLGDIFLKAKGKPLVFLIDEAHRLGNIRPESDQFRTFVGAFRDLFEKKVKAGLIFAMGAGTTEDLPKVFGEEEIKSRLSDYFAQMDQLNDEDIQQIVVNTIRYARDGWDRAKNKPNAPSDDTKQKIANLRKKGYGVTENSYPFEEDALKEIYNIFADPNYLSRATPREITEVLNDCASEESAFKDGLVTRQVVQRILGERQNRARPAPTGN